MNQIKIILKFKIKSKELLETEAAATQNNLLIKENKNKIQVSKWKEKNERVNKLNKYVRGREYLPNTNIMKKKTTSLYD